MHAQHSPCKGRRPAALACSVLLVLAAGCQQGKAPGTAQSVTEIAWARVALERNPNLEVLATDTDAGVFTVRDRASGAVYALKLSELAATPVAQLKASPSAPAPATAPSAAASPPSAPAPATDTPPDASVARSGEPSSAPESDASASDTTTDTRGYTIERSDGQVRVSGPGVSIVSTPARSTASTRVAAAEAPTDPIICEGRQLIHLDNRNIFVNGDALVARGGCELHLTNSRIVASGTALVVNGATVHVNNSIVEGKTAAYDADGSARMYVRGSTFTGAQRRHPYAVVEDLGGNEWKRAQAAAAPQE